VLQSPNYLTRPLTPKQLIALRLAAENKLRPGEQCLGWRMIATWTHDAVDYASQVIALRRKGLIRYGGRHGTVSVTPIGALELNLDPTALLQDS
jgi:hypothetical protein